ncbi:MAG: CHAD domain-containing protein [Bacteroidetes bacterium]|nr:CHAD domain-containing protein [Bacteroidota bacterium]
MESSKVREFYWRFFKKRITSFLANLYRSSITGDERDIHRTRLDMKKINSILEMFEMLNPDKFSTENFEVFKSMFRFSGKIRELQVNQLVIAKYGPETKGISFFIKYLRSRENRLSKQFLTVVQQFDEKKLKKSERAIKKLCREIKVRTLKARLEKFINKKAKKISLLRNYPSNPDNIHGIRKELKAMVTVLTLVSMVFMDEHQDILLSKLNQTEMLIGNWHDNQVLIEYIDRFLYKSKKLGRDYQLHLQVLRNKIMKSNQELLQALFPKIEEALVVIFPSSQPS